MTRPTHTRWGIYWLVIVIGGVVLAAITLAARIAWEELH